MATTNVPVEETVKKIVSKIIRKPESEWNPNATFKEMQADSLDVVQIMVAIEDTYNIELQDEELQKITDMKSFIKYVEDKVAAKK